MQIADLEVTLQLHFSGDVYSIWQYGHLFSRGSKTIWNKSSQVMQLQ